MACTQGAGRKADGQQTDSYNRQARKKKSRRQRRLSMPKCPPRMPQMGPGLVHAKCQLTAPKSALPPHARAFHPPFWSCRNSLTFFPAAFLPAVALFSFFGGIVSCKRRGHGATFQGIGRQGREKDDSPRETTGHFSPPGFFSLSPRSPNTTRSPGTQSNRTAPHTLL